MKNDIYDHIERYQNQEKIINELSIESQDKTRNINSLENDLENLQNRLSE